MPRCPSRPPGPPADSWAWSPRAAGPRGHVGSGRGDVRRKAPFEPYDVGIDPRLGAEISRQSPPGGPPRPPADSWTWRAVGSYAALPRLGSAGKSQYMARLFAPKGTLTLMSRSSSRCNGRAGPAGRASVLMTAKRRYCTALLAASLNFNLTTTPGWTMYYSDPSLQASCICLCWSWCWLC